MAELLAVVDVWVTGVCWNPLQRHWDLPPALVQPQAGSGGYWNGICGCLMQLVAKPFLPWLWAGCRLHLWVLPAAVPSPRDTAEFFWTRMRHSYTPAPWGPVPLPGAASPPHNPLGHTCGIVYPRSITRPKPLCRTWREPHLLCLERK